MVEDLLGLTKRELEVQELDNVVSISNVNSTVELRNIRSSIDKKPHHVFFYFDLSDNSVMTMAVLKFENVSFLTRVRLKRINGSKCGSYVRTVTITNKKEAVISYVHENVVKAI